MRVFVVLLLVVFVAIAQASKSDHRLNIAQWEMYKVKYNKTYLNRSEDEFRMKVFLENNRTIAEHNSKYEQGLVSYKLGHNMYSDMTHEEFSRTMKGFRKPRSHRRSNGQKFIAPAHAIDVETVDWRKKGAVTPVKNQGSCGSCWAFSAIGALESQHFLKTGQLVTLSEQNLVDCSGSEYGNYGCGGGWMDSAFQYIMDNGGIDTEEGYPYEGKDNECRYDPAYNGSVVRGFVDLPMGDEEKLKEAVATVGPVAVAMDSLGLDFYLLEEGIYDPPICTSTDLDHAVLVVGFGTGKGKDYWLMKNSWGSSWGENGYFKIVRNKNNYCGIASAASYPLV